MKIVRGFHQFQALKLNESIKDNIINWFSKNLGGDINELDSGIDLMKKIELDFIKIEHDALMKFIRLQKSAIKLASNKDKATELTRQRIKDMSSELTYEISSATKSYRDELRKLEANAERLADKNPRKARYYNIRRAQDSVETKALRWQFWKQLIKTSSVQTLQTMADNLKSIPTPDKVESDYREMVRDLKIQNQRTLRDILNREDTSDVE